MRELITSELHKVSTGRFFHLTLGSSLILLIDEGSGYSLASCAVLKSAWVTLFKFCGIWTLLVRHLRRCEEILLDLQLAIDGRARGRTPLVICGALLTSFLKPPLPILNFAIVIDIFHLKALLSPAQFVFLVNALRELSHRTLYL